MILPALVALPTALGPLLRGSWDLWTQCLIHAGVAVGITAWLSARAATGYFPAPSKRSLLWAASLMCLALASVWASPLKSLPLAEGWAFMGGAWLFLILPAVGKDERRIIDQAIRVSAWILMVLACYQRLSLGDERPASALVNQNVYAGAILMLLPLALETRDWLLAFGLLLNLWWAHSVGAWLGLSAALVVTLRFRSGAGFWAGVLGGLACLILIYNKFQSPEVLNRWDWWRSAAAMIYDRPLLGWGPGSFPHALHAYREGGGLATTYAHQFFLQVGAEYGLPFALIYFTGIWNCVLRGTSYKRFGALAALFHSLWDWPLSMPSNLWLFSYFAASSLRHEDRGVNIPARWKPALIAFIAACGSLLVFGASRLWRVDRAVARAAYELENGRTEESLSLAAQALALDARHPAAHLISAQAHWSRGDAGLDAAAGSLERAAAANPFRAHTWTMLESAYRRMGREDLAQGARKRGERWCARLRNRP